MDLEDFRAVLRNYGVDLWTLIDTAISVAARDHGKELKARRDGIVEQLYGASAVGRCESCDAGEGPLRLCGAEVGGREKGRARGVAAEEKESVNHEGRRGGSGSPSTPPSPPVRREEVGHEEEEEVEVEEQEDDRDGRRYGRPIDDEQTKILAIKEHLEDPDQSEDSLVRLLQNLADMDITFKALKETDIGRHVNGLRKHPSSEVRRLVKQHVRKWKDMVDEWVKLNSHETATSAIITDGDSPQQFPAKSSSQNGNHVPDFGYSPNPHNGGSSSDKANWEVEPRAKAMPLRETPAKPSHPTPPPPSAAPAKAKEQKDSLLDPERLASARRRLHENYQEAENAKKQRTIQVMDIHDIPKPKNSFFPRNKGGFQAKHW